MAHVTRTTPQVADDRGAGGPSLEASLIATVAPLMRHLVAHARRRRAWRDMTYQQYNVLRLIDTIGPQPQAEVARRLVVTAPVVTRLAAALAEAGLVERQDDPKDRRAVILALTADRTPSSARHAPGPARGRPTSCSSRSPRTGARRSPRRSRSSRSCSRSHSARR